MTEDHDYRDDHDGTRCAVKSCRGTPALIYLSHALCWECWERLCEDEMRCEEERYQAAMRTAPAQPPHGE